ncbi:hypothetical protein ACLM5H_16675 [Fredinandcohnia humi]
MKYLDMQMLVFVGASLVHEYWLFWGLPRVYYLDVKREHEKTINEDNKRIA